MSGTDSSESVPLIVAIDGPSGVGKSTVGRAVAARLGVPYVDTGAMYRAIGIAARRKGVVLPITDPAPVLAAARSASIDLATDPARGAARVLLDGEDVSDEIREPEIALFASAVSALPPVRRRLVSLQREIGRRRGAVLEGRDIGTVVFPETPWKFFLSASDDVRAARRVADLERLGKPTEFERVLRDQRSRDAADSTREDSPLVCDERYVRIDTDALSVDEVVGRILAVVRAGNGSTPFV